MPRNFDTELEQDLSFVAAGETFTMKLASPQVMARYEDEPDAENAQDSIERLNARMADFLVPGDVERWNALMAAETVPFVQLAAISRWAWEVQTGRPTTPVSPSPGGRGNTGATSSGDEAARGATARSAARSRAGRR